MKKYKALKLMLISSLVMLFGVSLSIYSTNIEAKTKSVKSHKVIKKSYKKNSNVYKPNKAKIKNEFMKLLKPDLIKHNKSVGFGNVTDYYLEQDERGYGGEYSAMFSSYVKSDKQVAKALYDSLKHGTLPNYLNTNETENQKVAIDHIETSGKTYKKGKNWDLVRAKIYLTWSDKKGEFIYY